ncbi:MAG TPA: VOC family protein [Chitinophagaceae bacterium]|nr:VOC family protein [Chitinophagaceae bacterium]
MKQVNPYISFAGNCEEAFKFYHNIFGGKLQFIRFKEMGEEIPGLDNLTEEKLNMIANIALPIGANTMLMGDDGAGVFGNGVSNADRINIEIEAESAKEADRLFNALSDGGKVKMKLTKTSWAEKFGQCTDPFGVKWMVNYSL